MYKQIENEREERARVEVKYEKAIKRINKVEELTGTHEYETKPQSIVDMENELADIRMLFKSQVTEL
jgi:hypothetical protein